MKKVLIYIFLILVLFLVGCKKDETPDDNNDDNTLNNEYSDYLDKINIPSEVSESFYLPATVNTNNDHDIYWKSSNNDSIKISSSITEIDGLLYNNATVKQSGIDVVVTLTMTLTVNNVGTMEKDFEVKVKKYDLLNSDVISFNFYAINDYHGAVLDEDTGMGIIGGYLINEKTNNPDTTIILSSGDMFQGSAISNMTEGQVVVEAMNKIGFDSMSLGNHEFDWGIDVIKNYNNKTSEIKSQFPIICCNVYEKETNEPVDWVDPYTVVEKAGVKIGIIGAIGVGLEDSIAYSMVKDYEFKDPMPLIKKYAKELRSEKGCKLVILSIHDNTSSINQMIADLSGEYQVDAIFNGHTHSVYAGETQGTDGIYTPYIQSGSSGSNIGKVTLVYNKKTNKVEECSAENIKVSKSLSHVNLEIKAILDKHNEDVSVISDQVIGVSGEAIDKVSGAKWAANVIRDYGNCQIGFINGGGIRNSAFPIEKDQEITIGKVWEIMPFDNFVKKCVMTVEDIKKAYFGNDVISSDNIRVEGDSLYINDTLCNEGETFTVAVIDYIFDKTTYPFQNSTNQEVDVLFREYLIQAIKDCVSEKGKWYLK